VAAAEGLGTLRPAGQAIFPVRHHQSSKLASRPATQHPQQQQQQQLRHAVVVAASVKQVRVREDVIMYACSSTHVFGRIGWDGVHVTDGCTLLTVEH
jgi:hypothetical protein